MSEELTKTKLLPIQGKDMDSIMQNLETGVLRNSIWNRSGNFPAYGPRATVPYT